MTKASVTCKGVDITSQVAVLYDAIVTSLDWGSNFLDDEQVEAILIVARMVGFDMAYPHFTEPMAAYRGAGGTKEKQAKYDEMMQMCKTRYLAKLDAKIQEMTENPLPGLPTEGDEGRK